jgi:hypothetical protein
MKLIWPNILRITGLPPLQCVFTFVTPEEDSAEALKSIAQSLSMISTWVQIIGFLTSLSALSALGAVLFHR